MDIIYNSFMTIKTAQWNIGGGKLRIQGSSPEHEGSYSMDGLGEIIQNLRGQLPDIITLQETHTGQAEEIARRFGYHHFVH